VSSPSHDASQIRVAPHGDAQRDHPESPQAVVPLARGLTAKSRHVGLTRPRLFYFFVAGVNTNNAVGHLVRLGVQAEEARRVQRVQRVEPARSLALIVGTPQ